MHVHELLIPEGYNKCCETLPLRSFSDQRQRGRWNGPPSRPALLSGNSCWNSLCVPPTQGRSINFPHILITMSASGECCEIGYFPKAKQARILTREDRSRASAERERGDWLSSIINYNIPQMSDRERLGTRQVGHNKKEQESLRFIK